MNKPYYHPITFSLALFAYPLLYANYTEDEEINKRLFVQQGLYRVKGWCLVDYQGKNCSGEILKINDQDDTFIVKIIDTTIPVKNWEKLKVPIRSVKSHLHKNTQSSEALFKCLKKMSILRTPAIENAFVAIDRSWFCPTHPFSDSSIKIECDQCICSPSMHIFYLEMLKDIFPRAKAILDVGSGSGYLTASLAYLSPKAKVVGIDYYETLVEKSRKTCTDHLSEDLNDRLLLLAGPGSQGYMQQAPYDIICVDYMCKEVPEELIKQLAPNGRMLIPLANRKCSYDTNLVGGDLWVLEKNNKGKVSKHRAFSCSFVIDQEEKIELANFK